MTRKFDRLSLIIAQSEQLEQHIADLKADGQDTTIMKEILLFKLRELLRTVKGQRK